MVDKNKYNKSKRGAMTQQEFEDFHNYNIESNSAERERK